MARPPVLSFGFGSVRGAVPHRAGFGRRRSFAAPLAVGLTVAAPGLVAEGRAQEPAVTSLPHAINLRGYDGNESAFSLLSFGCYPLESGREESSGNNKATCRFTTTSIFRPTAEDVAKRLRDLDAPPGPPAATDSFPAVCQTLTPLGPPPAGGAAISPERRYQEQLAKACSANDAALGKEALRFGISEVWAKTCEVFNYGFREYDFEKIDDSTWRAMNGASGGTATIRTIWRKKAGNDLTSWNYKQVTSSDPSCVPTPFAECAKDSVQDWTPDAAIKLAGCQYFK
jgi:hypothetical protein